MPSKGPVEHPAWIIREWLEARGLSQVWLAEQIGRSPKNVNQILRGHVLWTPELALRIEQATGISAARLMRMKAEYELDQARSLQGSS